MAVLLLLCTAAVCAQTSAASSPAAGASGVSVPGTSVEEYVISPDDVLDIYIVDVPELSRNYRVGPTGTVKFPLLERPLTAAGLTLTAFSDRITAELKSAGLISAPQVTVSVQQSRLHAIAVTGAVKRPQIYPVLGRTTLLDVLSQAEGLADDASSTAIVRRGDLAAAALGLETEGKSKGEAEAILTVSVDLRHLLESGDSSANLDLYPGDRVTIPKAGIVYVVGAVNRPGGFTLKAAQKGMTVLQALAMAEDVKSTALRERAMLIRAGGPAAGERQQVPVDLKKVLAGKAPDPVLQADDILFVPDSAGSKAFRRGLEAVLQAATGVVIYRR